MGDRAYVVHPVLTGKADGHNGRTPEQALEEITSLTAAINLEIFGAESIAIRKTSPSTFLGKGTVERLADRFQDDVPDIVILNSDLSPVQQRNLERALHTKVIDRTGLILEIFGERAQTKEGRIQVELAALEYQKSRLVRSWTHLERQRGGAGFMGGPGETQIEIDRRIISERITHLKKELEKVKKTRDLGRKARERVPFPIVALVGYTNAGKSTLFNAMTQSCVMAEDLLFATLDPTMRKLNLPNGTRVIVSDTVGFISDLPTTLIAAFRSTLDQVRYADIILHVRDIARPDTQAQKMDVIRVLNDLGIDYDMDPRILEVWNKVDALTEEDKGIVSRQAERKGNCIALSALTGEGASLLLNAMTEKLEHNTREYHLNVPHKNGEAVSWLYTHGKVLERKDGVGDIALCVRLHKQDYERFRAHFEIPSFDAPERIENE